MKSEKTIFKRNSFAVGVVALFLGANLCALAQDRPEALPETLVTARKQKEPLDTLPLSVTVVPLSLDDPAFRTVRETSQAAPDVFVNEFSARAISNPFFRGVGGSPMNPGVTTYIDGVPQLNAYSSNIELVDVAQVEFVRGPQGALFGRNTPGGLINISSVRPSTDWTGHAEADYGNFASRSFRGGISGPINSDTNTLFSAAGGYAARQGYTRNLFDGKDVDSREAGFVKVQGLWQANENLEVRLLLTGEADRDGDYALGDLGSLKQHPRRVLRDFTGGHNDRDVFAPTLIATYDAGKVTVENTAGFVYWRNEGLTDLDYGVATPQNFFLNGTRLNKERQSQVTEELRFASDKESPISISDQMDLHWQAGVFLFYRDYSQDARNSFAPPLAMLSSRTSADLEDFGAGLYSQLRLEVFKKLEISAGARVDVEDKDAHLGSPLGSQDLEQTYTQFSPQAGLQYKLCEAASIYTTLARGYKAGGFNPPPAPSGAESYDTEHSWNYEIGLKTRALEGKLRAAASAFYIHWDDLQLNQQYPGAAGQYYVGNAGAAASKGVELEGAYRVLPWLDVFASGAVMEAKFLSGSTAFNANASRNENVDGNHLPFAPAFTVSGGTEASWKLCSAVTLYGRAQVTGYGKFYYDSSNAEYQDAYTLADFRAGLRASHWFVEGWVANAFDTEYVPIAIPYAQLGAPSGYVGENGAPAVFGIRGGLFF